MPWQKLRPRISARVRVPAIGIQKNGRIAWNEGTQKALGEPEWVELLYDEKEKKLGLRKVEQSEEAFPVRKAGRQRTWGISALGALKSIGIEIDAAYRRYADIEGDVVSIDVSGLFEGRSQTKVTTR